MRRTHAYLVLGDGGRRRGGLGEVGPELGVLGLQQADLGAQLALDQLSMHVLLLQLAPLQQQES
jgi:hypothetical protein